MNSNPTLYLTIGLLTVVAVAAQVPSQTPEYEQPVNRQWDEGNCHQLMIESLYKATNPNDPLQDGYLKAAQAYEQLDKGGQTC